MTPRPYRLKLTASDVQRMRVAYEGGASRKSIAEVFSIAPSTVSLYASRHGWTCERPEWRGNYPHKRKANATL